jgi:hypothetical protein
MFLTAILLCMAGLYGCLKGYSFAECYGTATDALYWLYGAIIATIGLLLCVAVMLIDGGLI